MSKILLVDLDTGRYITQLKQIGHEVYNLDRNLNGNFYGIVPPGNDRVSIERIDGTAKSNKFLDDVLVVYVKKVRPKCNDRTIIAFCENARVYRDVQSGVGMNRDITQPNGTIDVANWHIESDNLKDLRGVSAKYVIPIASSTIYGNTVKLFRGQRSFLDTCAPQIKVDILGYLASYKLSLSAIDDDLGDDQDAIQNEPVPPNPIQPIKDKKCNSTKGMSIKKNPARAKWVLHDSGYKCLHDSSHITFKNHKGNPYMEGHHLIPCTVKNSDEIDALYHSPIDREENIVCICPNCHRAIHFGDKATQTAIITDLFHKQKAKLNSVGIMISPVDLINRY